MTALWVIVLCGALSIVYAIWATASVMKADAGNPRMQEIAAAVREGAQAYLKRQYMTIAVVGIVIFALLAYFISHPAETLSRDRLLDEVWGYDNYPNTRTVDAHIVHLRQKLELNPEEPRFILTVHGSGYKFVG